MDQAAPGEVVALGDVSEQLMRGLSPLRMPPRDWGVATAAVVAAAAAVPDSAEYFADIVPLGVVEGQGVACEAFGGEQGGRHLVAPAAGVWLPTIGPGPVWQLGQCDMEELMSQSPRALHAVLLSSCDRAGVHLGITAVSGKLSGPGVRTPLTIEVGLMGSINLLTAGSPKVGSVCG